jgi:hypothetical protein
MSFASPWLLLGLLAALLPIAIHLFHRRRAVRRPFPAIEFLLRSNRKIARGLKVRQILLLALRVALFVLLPLAMAQPWIDCGGASSADLGDARLPATVVIVLDESASMSTPVGRGTAWDEAVRQALAMVDDLRPWDRVAVVFAGGAARAPFAEPAEDRARVRDRIRGHVPQHGGSDLVEALQVAAELHARSDLPERRTVVFTDGAAHAWPGDGVRAGIGRLLPVDVAGGPPAFNHAVESIAWERTGEAGQGTWRIDAGLRRWGAGASQATVTLAVDGEVVGTAPVELPADGRATVAFTHAFEQTGLVRLRVTVTDGTGPSADDALEVPMGIGRPARAVLVNGDARSVALQDELFFIERALEATMEGPGAVDVRSVAPSALAGLDWDAVDVVVLANVASLPAEEVRSLRSFVEQGGGLLFTCGSNTDPAVWNATFGDLLPKPIRDVKLLSERYDPDAAIKVTRVGTVDTAHPIFRVFDGAGGESLQSVAAYRYALLEPVADDAVHTLASFRDGGPALLEKTIGRGRVLLWTTTIDFDWTDLPIRTAFVPFVRRTIDHLARRTGGGAPDAAPGRPMELWVDAWGATQVTIVDPEGARTVLDVDEGRAIYLPERRGLHTVALGEGAAAFPVDELAFLATAPAVESDLRPVSEERLQALREAGLEGMALGEGGGLPPGRRDVWPLLLLITMLVLYGETLLAVRRRVWGAVRSLVGRARG